MTQAVLKLKKINSQRLRSLALNESWLQQQILDDPSLLGLGDLQVIKRERIQASGGRIDFLMADFENDTRYEVEVMLGPVDESHIIRTIEYWDVERQRYPSLQHCAVIVAEEITSRFFNVIRLLNRAVPLIAIQLSAFQIDNEVALQFIRVLDTHEFNPNGDGDEPQSPEANRAYWEARTKPELLAVVDACCSLVPATSGEAKLYYNKSHIALTTGGYLFCWFFPRKVASHCAVWIKVGATERQSIIDNLEAAGLEALSKGKESIRMNVRMDDIHKHRNALIELFRKAEEWSQR
ncbi:hypothetical protein IVB33_03460 [Bradyrhizobium sp. 24]|uniref:hypothetical protein n=1 Tax=unclassified Bradyrhizobium TaxID=2631580 RepID=UPI001FFA6B5C|nr:MULTISPECIES: hypothetical protein [unclassified Bradyrhizobium]MCK1297338.1 hypothetical protein [Bradyrhizobium sp. 37]MCK1377509.1 hypothetical protein [Bradyrhizobium sp. 24]MCK1769344.1 hypothetical protein [Bradyrhizobium sp. 134]UPJ41112.1 hypothetical protein IVB40_28070 [Bradyrhizobium sp. 40]